MKISEILDKASETLKEGGIETSRLDARVLLCYVLDISHEALISKREETICDVDAKRYRNLIDRRLDREPVSCITGIKEFWSMEFITSPDTLDPRPDSEIIIETVLDLYPRKSASLNILDLGTGTGCLLLSVLSEYPNARGIGVDISEKAIATAKENAIRLDLEKRSEFLQNNWCDGLSEKFDIILCNPPYIKTGDIKNLAPEVSEYDPHIALDGGYDGIYSYKKISKNIKGSLNCDGNIFFEIGDGQEEQLKIILEANGLAIKQTSPDLSGIARCLICHTDSTIR